MKDIKILSSDDVRRLVSIGEAIEAVALSYRELSDGRTQMPVRTVTDFDYDDLTVFYKPSYMASGHIAGVKLLTQLRSGGRNGYPTIQGIVLLIDAENNTTKAIVDGTYLTALRTGAASGVATRALAREDASTLAIFGAGAQAYTQFEAICSVRPIKKVYVFDIRSEAVSRFIDTFRGRGVEILPGDDISRLTEADVICTVTNSSTPLFPREVLKKGVHINAIGSYAPGMRELPDDIYVGSSLFVDHRDSCFSESGDIIVPLSKGLLPDEAYKGEIGEVLTGKVRGRESRDEITVFKSVGIAVQDLVTANYAYMKACREMEGANITI